MARHTLVQRKKHLSARNVLDIGHSFRQRFGNLLHGRRLVAKLHDRICNRLSMNSNCVHRASKTIRRRAATRRTDPNGIVIDHRRLSGGTTHVPFAWFGFTIDPTLNAGWFAKSIRYRDMVPQFSRLESVVRSPAMPMRIRPSASAFAWSRKEKTDATFFFIFFYPQCPVLIVSDESTIARSPFADHINMFILAKLFYLYPCLQRDGIPSREIELTIGTGIVEYIVRTLTIELDRMIVRFKVRILGCSRARNVALHSTHRLESRSFFFAEIPSNDGLVVRKRQNGATSYQREKRNEEDCLFHSAGSAQEGSGKNTCSNYTQL